MLDTGTADPHDTGERTHGLSPGLRRVRTRRADALITALAAAGLAVSALLGGALATADGTGVRVDECVTSAADAPGGC
ncbi:hypothetical protein [Streptomyces sp. NPDC086787]|uniref:hypothetical protein n=1 Tax=Streptomyces sp. NPDC086787 TaxID=3365759 RepID=UPI00383086C6